MKDERVVYEIDLHPTFMNEIQSYDGALLPIVSAPKCENFKYSIIQ